MMPEEDTFSTVCIRAGDQDNRSKWKKVEQVMARVCEGPAKIGQRHIHCTMEDHMSKRCIGIR